MPASHGYCLLKTLLMPLSRMERVILVVVGRGVLVCICGEATTIAVVGVLKLMGWS